MTRYQLAICASACSLIEAVPGCTSNGGLKLEMTTNPPGEVVVSTTMIQIPQGVAVGIKASTKGSQSDDASDTYISLKSTNPAVVQAWPTTRDNTFAICGSSEGNTDIRVYIDGQDSDSVPVVVTAPIGSVEP